MSSNRPPIELPPTIITPNPRPTLPPLVFTPPSRPAYQARVEKAMPLDNLGNLPFDSFDERNSNTMAVAMLVGVREMQQAYESARSTVEKNTSADLVSAGFKGDAADSDTVQLEINQAVLSEAINATQLRIPLELANARSFFNGADPHSYGGVQAFNYMYRTKQLYGQGVANRSYRAWIASYQAQYEVALLEAQLAYLKQQQDALNKQLDALEKARVAYHSPALQATTTPMVLGRAGALSVSSTARLTLIAAIEAAVARITAGLPQALAHRSPCLPGWFTPRNSAMAHASPPRFRWPNCTPLTRTCRHWPPLGVT